jgi:hypothetical protein
MTTLGERVDELEHRVELLMEHLFPPAKSHTGKEPEPAIDALERSVVRGRTS